MPPPDEPTLRGQLRRAIERAWSRSIAAGDLPALADADAAGAVKVERPANPDHGDAATNLALKLAKPYRRSPLEIAGVLAAELGREAARSSTPIAPSRRPR